MSLKFRCHHDSQVNDTAKYTKYSWRERGYFLRDIISPSGVNKTDKTQASLEFAHESPLIFYDFFFFFNVSWLWGVTAKLQPQESSPTFVQSKRVEIIAIKNKESELTFN